MTGTITAVVHARIDAILAPDYLDGLTSVSIEEVRARRTTCQAIEVSLSYLRRLVPSGAPSAGSSSPAASPSPSPSS